MPIVWRFQVTGDKISRIDTGQIHGPGEYGFGDLISYQRRSGNAVRHTVTMCRIPA
jgi:hypothetical protein